MAKVTQTNNLDSGLIARTNWNEALKSVDTDTTLTGDGNAGTPLSVVVDNDCNLPTDSPLIAPSVQAVKCYIDAQVSVGGFDRSYSYISRGGDAGTNYFSGYYYADSDDVLLDNFSPTVNWGTINVGYGAHAFIVSGGFGITDGADLVLTVSGTSIDDDGNRIPGDSEIIVADAQTANVNDYFETAKKWLGEITFTLTSTGSLNFTFNFNYGFAKYEDASNRDFTIRTFEVVGRANANSTFNIELLHHSVNGWTFAATNFIPGGNTICSWSGDYVVETSIVNGEPFAYKRVNLSQIIAGALSEGVVIRITTSNNNAIWFLNAHLSGDLIAL